MNNVEVNDLDINLENNNFLGTLLYHLSGVLQDTIGLEDSRGLVSVVGRYMGDEINQEYKNALSLHKLPKNLLAKVLVDLKARINGQFYVILEDDNKIIFGNKRCPFGDKVIGRPSLCMMTTNVFGKIASESTGYAKVSIDKAIALGDDECRVTVHLNQNSLSEDLPGREFYGES
ncbi:methanogen output domain 1-containing protein [Francisellaceae bacterium]|nr:methanogen output domain 1-containing protein [Francisellaceae bacterium]